MSGREISITHMARCAAAHSLAGSPPLPDTIDMPTSPDASPAASPPAASEPMRAEALFTQLYEELRRMARREARRNGAHDYVSTGTLVHEAWLDISQRPSLEFQDRGRFLAYAARTMRGLVIDRIRARQSQKRGGGVDITSLDTESAEQILQPDTLEGISEAMDEMAAMEPELAHVVDLKFFCGFTLAEIAVMQEVSERTVQRQWEKARLFLHQALS